MTRRPWYQRLVAGWAVALAILALVELGAHAVRGRPPDTESIARIGRCSVKPAGLMCEGQPNVPVEPKGARPRVIVYGGSTVRNPFSTPDGDFPTVLAALMPSIEVINFGIPGTDTAAALKLVSESAVLQPDLLVIHTGHNDYNSAVFQGRIKAVALWRLPLEQALSKSWIRAWLTPRREVRRANGPSNLFAVTDGVVLGERTRVDTRFEAELTDLLEVAPTPVLLTTLFRNFDAPPQGVDARGWPGCAAVIERIPNQRISAREMQPKAQDVERACGENAFTAWVTAHLGRASALDDWHRSLDMDAAPLRAPYSADVILRRVAKRTGTPLVDLAAVKGGMQPGEWFFDPLHTTAAGAREMARALQPEVARILAARAGR